MRTFLVVMASLCAANAASGQATSDSLVIKVIAEVSTKTARSGREAPQLIPAERVVPGDPVIYTVEIRNASRASIAAPVVIRPVPVHMAYVAESATGPGAEVSYSADGGHNFDRPENLRVVDENGQLRLAKPSEYTHIRWKLKNSLKANSVAFAHFRAVVK